MVQPALTSAIGGRSYRPLSVVIRRRTSAELPSCAVAAALAVVALTLGWRGGDWPAQLYRVDLFQRAGFTQWDNYWYGGHHAPGYSLLYPVLAAVFGITVIAVCSVVVANVELRRDGSPLAERAACRFGAVRSGHRDEHRGRSAHIRVGLAIGMAAVAAMTFGRRGTASALAPFTAFASPVAGVFLMLAATVWVFPCDRFGASVSP